jgi:hypothetical protein
MHFLCMCCCLISRKHNSDCFLKPKPHLPFCTLAGLLSAVAAGCTAMEHILQQQQQQCAALPDVVLQLAVAHIKLWQQIIDFTIWSSSDARQSILTNSRDLLLTVQPAARLSAAVLVAVPRGCIAWQGALAAGVFVIEALSKEVQNIGGDPAGIPLPSSHAAAAAAESGSSEAPQQQQRQQHWEQVLFEPAVLHLLLASKASIVRHLWHLSNNTGAGSNQAAAAAVQPYHEDLLSAMGVPPAGRQQRGVWDIADRAGHTESSGKHIDGNAVSVAQVAAGAAAAGAEVWQRQQQCPRYLHPHQPGAAAAAAAADT